MSELLNAEDAHYVRLSVIVTWLQHVDVNSSTSYIIL